MNILIVHNGGGDSSRKGRRDQVYIKHNNAVNIA